MSTYVTTVKWTREMSADELAQLQAYLDTQTAGNGTETTYEGQFARSWVDESAAIAFCDFAKALQKNQKFPTIATVNTVA
jgi:hypothetical protein